MDNLDMPSWSVVTVGVADLDRALKLWVDDFGFEIADSSSGPDSALAELWSIDADDIARQALVRTRGSRHGMLHLIEFANPDPPVRQGANVFDSLPKNLDIYVEDMPDRVAELKAAGHTFRNDTFSEVVAPNGTTFREIQFTGHDLINIVLLEILASELTAPPGHFAGVGPLILIVDDAAAERAFYRDIIGLDVLSDNVLDGPEIERMVGLPKGAALDVSIWGRSGHPFGQIEIIDYRGVDGESRYARARPKSLGVLHVGYEVPRLEPLRRLLDERRIEFGEHRDVQTLYGRGSVLALYTPAGFRVEVHERRE